MIKKHIPNSITCCNLVSGCIATAFAFAGDAELALIWIIIGAVFDFFDGMSARLLGVSSPIGKELDSLADVVTFGVAPATILLSCLFRALAQLSSLRCFPRLSLFSFALSKVQSRRKTGHFVHRFAHSSQRFVLGFAHRLQSFVARKFSIFRLYRASIAWLELCAIGVGTADVRSEIQALGVERQ